MGDCGWEPRDLAVTLGSSQESRTTGDAATCGEPGVRLKPEKNKPSGPYVFFFSPLTLSLFATPTIQWCVGGCREGGWWVAGLRCSLTYRLLLMFVAFRITGSLSACVMQSLRPPRGRM